MDELHVGLLNDSFPPQIDGVANVVKNYADILTREYGRATVVTPAYPHTDDSKYPYEVIRTVSFNTTKWVGYRTGYPFDEKTIDRVTQLPIDLLHVHCPFVTAMMGRILRESLNVPLVFTYHTKYDIDVRNAVRLKLVQERALRFIVDNIEACDDVWVVSEGAGKNLRSIGYNGDYTVMRNGVDVPKGRADDAAIEAVRKEYGLKKSVPTFLFVGRLMWYKGLRLILDACKKLKMQEKGFCMVFVGDGGDRDEVEAYAKELALGKSCIFTGAIHDRDKLRAIYGACDLFLFPSTFDTNGLVVREAAASGLASVLIDDSCAAEGVEDGKTGILIAETDDALANTLLLATTHRSEMRNMGARAMDTLYYSWEDAVRAAVERYRLILHDSAGVPKQHKWTPSGEFLLGISEMYEANARRRAYPSWLTPKYKKRT